MPEAGFFEQKRGSPTGFAAVVAIHAAVLGALLLMKGPQFILPVRPPLVITPIPLAVDPPPVPPRTEETRRPTMIDRTTRIFDDLIDDPVIDQRPPDPPRPPDRIADAARVEVLPPVRREAELIGGDLQPPYPASEERAQRGGSVRLRVTIGPDGRVVAVQRISATSDAFWRATERQALSRWRFRPATVDGRPVEATRVMTVTFRIDNV